ncbi:Trypsin [compost metagenome]
MGVPYKTNLNVTNYQLTAPFIEVDQSQGKGLCKGDSGGPGIISRDGKNYVVGIVKGGQPTKQEPLPRQDQDRCNGRGYFLNLQFGDYLSWIDSELDSAPSQP